MAGIYRVIIFRETFYDKDYDSRDTLATTVSSVEVNLAIIASCGPALQPLVGKMLPGLFSSKGGSYPANCDTPGTYGHGMKPKYTPRNGSFPLRICTSAKKVLKDIGSLPTVAKKTL